MINLGARNLAYLCDMLSEILADIDERGDSCVWTLGSDSMFTMTESRRLIDSKILPSWSPRTKWDKTIPLKVNIFIWKISLDRLPNKSNLFSRGIDIPTISCPSCNGNVESSNHIFFECDIAKEV